MRQQIYIIFFVLFFAVACAKSPGKIEPINTPTATLKFLTTNTKTVTPRPTLTKLSLTPTLPVKSATASPPTATFDTLRNTPPTIMLHRSNENFDSVFFLKELVTILKEKDFMVITYEDITKQPDITILEKGHLFIITIDDIGLQAPLDPSIEQMIKILEEAGYPAVLGIITEGKLPDAKTAARLKKLADAGWELAMHTDTHVNLNQLAQDMPYAARLEIRTCREKILDATGVTANTLVLPYGDNVADLKILYREKVTWTVGIGGGNKYRTSNWTYYVGREGPSGNALETFNIIIERFNP
ncbi:MAG: polysaccharide deacetylase family protein [Anaerolineae bacterium]|nr:polysaccharide deacetylase family protein [Anaerolineae bacterium]